MSSRRLRRATLLALPGVLLAIAGTAHPQHLTYATSARWAVLHVVGLPVFPLLGIAVAALVRRRQDPLAVVVMLASYVYAVSYGAFEVIDGIGAAYVTHRVGPGAPRPHEVGYLFHVGGLIGPYGTYALLLAATLVAAERLWRHRLRALAPAVLLVAGAGSYVTSHIFWWRGVLTVLVIGLATGWLAWLDHTDGSPQGRRSGQ